MGHFFGALDIESFRDKTEFKKDIDDWIRIMRSTKPLPGTEGVLIPSDPERQAYGIRVKEGIPVNKEVVAFLEVIADQSIEFSNFIHRDIENFIEYFQVTCNNQLSNQNPLF